MQGILLKLTFSAMYPEEELCLEHSIFCLSQESLNIRNMNLGWLHYVAEVTQQLCPEGFSGGKGLKFAMGTTGNFLGLAHFLGLVWLTLLPEFLQFQVGREGKEKQSLFPEIVLALSFSIIV